MKKSLLVFAALFFIVIYPLESQGLLNKLKNAATKQIPGTNKDESSSNSSKPGPEPNSARDDASLIVDLNKFKIDYNEITICEMVDGSILIKDKITGKYYVAKDGETEGPLDEGDPRIKECKGGNEEQSDSKGTEAWAAMYPAYITRSGDKFFIKFNGKNFGPYAVISDFAVAQSGDEFAAIVTENVMATEGQNKKMEEELAKAKTDQERMEIAMKYSQQILESMSQTGWTESLQPKLISNVPGANYDALTWQGGRLTGNVKFDEIVIIAQDKIIDIQGNTLIKLDPNLSYSKNLFLNSSNTAYATYNYGTLTFSDNTSLSELFHPRLVKTAGKVYLTYMYYSPGKNAIMQCALPF